MTLLMARTTRDMGGGGVKGINVLRKVECKWFGKKGKSTSEIFEPLFYSGWLKWNKLIVSI